MVQSSMQLIRGNDRDTVWTKVRKFFSVSIWDQEFGSVIINNNIINLKVAKARSELFPAQKRNDNIRRDRSVN